MTEARWERKMTGYLDRGRIARFGLWMALGTMLFLGLLLFGGYFIVVIFVLPFFPGILLVGIALAPLLFRCHRQFP